jgi:archaemetzincin
MASRYMVLPAQAMPKASLVKIKRVRHRADSLLQFLKEIKPDSINYLLALTEEDISVTVKDAQGKVKEPYRKYIDWGVFGYGYRPGPACIVSSFRLDQGHPEYYERLKKVILHELGHNLGLDHCSSPSCFMRDANEKLSTIDDEPLDMCEKCRRGMDDL